MLLQIVIEDQFNRDPHVKPAAGHLLISQLLVWPLGIIFSMNGRYRKADISLL